MSVPVRLLLTLSALHPFFFFSLYPYAGQAWLLLLPCFFPPLSSSVSLRSRACVIAHLLIFCLSLYLYPIIPPSCQLADLNPVLFWSSALGETNSLWLSAATHILSCPIALTACMRKRQRQGGGGGKEERERLREGGQVQRAAWKERKIGRKTHKWLGHFWEKNE